MAIEEPYTHKFKFQIGDGGRFLNGLIEFNEDQKVSYKIQEWSEPLEKDVLDDFTALTELLKTIFHKHGGIKLIKFTDKDE